MRWQSLALPVALLLLCSCGSDLARPAVGQPDGEIVPFEQVASAILTGPDTPSYRLILDQESWAAVWSEMVAGHVPPQPPLPSIDFESRILVFAAAGQLPTQLRSFTIEEVRLADSVLHITVREDWPAPQCGSLPVITRPVAVVSVPRLSIRADFVQERTSGC